MLVMMTKLVWMRYAKLMLRSLLSMMLLLAMMRLMVIVLLSPMCKTLLEVVDDDAECEYRWSSDVVGTASIADASHAANAAASQIVEQDADVDREVINPEEEC